MNSNQTLVLVILVVVVFFVFILPAIDAKNAEERKQLTEKFGETTEIRKIDQNVCSLQCCNPSQWPVPHMANTGSIPEADMGKYVGSNFSCNFGSSSGCVCLTKDDVGYLAERGKNGSTNTCSN